MIIALCVSDGNQSSSVNTQGTGREAVDKCGIGHHQQRSANSVPIPAIRSRRDVARVHRRRIPDCWTLCSCSRNHLEDPKSLPGKSCYKRSSVSNDQLPRALLHSHALVVAHHVAWKTHTDSVSWDTGWPATTSETNDEGLPGGDTIDQDFSHERMTSAILTLKQMEKRERRSGQ